ncbi:hypothetical protein QWJ34_22300 [Saccharibacillus sp. CPCC 101409]|uniref:hypothetical protein n=1 Tax=Saccharibacillus sp. CPCC 101409 TaxID=3058041 RepID=UPI0026730063|nr:hypothetical protein [Saccharibacillus sp. CPCC 101409]MDO3412513.1 hypothetical protein [Saccharibacillus sp. CPCC 101409]
MDTAIEERFVRQFCRKRIRERLLFELGSPNKRKAAMSRFSHNYADILIEEYRNELNKHDVHATWIIGQLKKLGAAESVYCLSYLEGIDGRSLGLDEAVRLVYGAGMPSIIVCGSSLAYFEAEQSAGAPPRFILKR